VPEEIFWTFMVQKKITKANTQAIWVGATLSGLISDPPPSSPIFHARCPSCCNPLTLSWLGTSTKYVGLHTQYTIYSIAGNDGKTSTTCLLLTRFIRKHLFVKTGRQMIACYVQQFNLQLQCHLIHCGMNFCIFVACI